MRLDYLTRVLNGQRREKKEAMYRTSRVEKSLFLSLFVEFLNLYIYYDAYNSPRSYRQPFGNGQSLSRRYCTQSVWLFSCA